MKSACAEKHILDTQNTNSPKIQTYRNIYIHIFRYSHCTEVATAHLKLYRILVDLSSQNFPSR